MENPVKLKPYEALLVKLISTGSILHHNLNFPAKYRYRHRPLVLQMYRAAVESLARRYRSCELLDAYKLLAVQLPSRITDNSTVIYGNQIVFIDLTLLNHVILEVFRNHPVAYAIPRA